MDQNHRDSNKIFQNINSHIDQATSVSELTPFLKIIPLHVIKDCLTQRLRNANAVGPVANSSACSNQYNEMRKLALSISPITDILSNDVMIHILSFLTHHNYEDHWKDKEQVKYYQWLPILSSTLNTIMNQFYHSKYPLNIYDIPMKKQRKQKNPSNGGDDPKTIHIQVNHSEMRMEIKHLKTQKFKSTKTIKKVPQLVPNQPLNSSLPWKTRNKLVIFGKEAKASNPRRRRMYGSPNTIPKPPNPPILNLQTANPNILNILSKTAPKWLHLNGPIPHFRLKQYPPFPTVIYLDITAMDYSKTSSLNVWLNNKQFPALRILSCKIPATMTQNAFNTFISSLNLRALHLSDSLKKRKIELNITSQTLQFLCLGERPSLNDYFREQEGPQNHFIKTLDLSGCDCLIGVQFHIQVPFSSITWNRQCDPLKFINVTIDDREIYGGYGQEWYKAESIHCDTVIGHCFFTTEPKLKHHSQTVLHRGRELTSSWQEYIEDGVSNEEIKYHTRRSMTFNQMVQHVGSSGWHRFYSSILLEEASFIQNISSNFPRWD